MLKYLRLFFVIFLTLFCAGSTSNRIAVLFGTKSYNPLFHRAYNVTTIPANATYFSFPGRIRPYEPQRTQLIVRNLGSTILQFGYTNNTNNGNLNAGSFTFSLNPGQEYRENGSSISMLFVRPNTSGQGGTYSVYTELNGQNQSGHSITQGITPVPVGIPVLNVTTYGTPTNIPCGISKDRTTVYGCKSFNATGSSSVYQTINDGTSWTTVHNFGSSNVIGLRETDDGEALVDIQGGSTVPGTINKSSGWSTSHTSATWSVALNSASNAFFQAIWGSTASFNCGSDPVNSTGKYCVAAEYGGQLNSGTDPTAPTHYYFSSNYGASYSQVLDIQTNPPAGYPMHSKAIAYDLYWDRLWVTFDTTFSTTNATILYSDDHGVSWNQFALSVEWQSTGGWISNQIGIFKNRIVFGSDHTDGYYVIPRVGYRKMGKGYTSVITATHTGGQQTNQAAYSNSPTSQFFTGLITESDVIAGQILCDANDDGQSLLEIWTDTALTNNSYGVQAQFGPTKNGNLLAHVVTPAGDQILIGTIIQGVAGQFDQYATLTGDGSTKTFTFPHFLSYTPATLLAYPQDVGAVGIAAPALTSDGTNITLTFSVAPSNGTAYEYALRYR